jgi:hypothetical protein
LSPRRRWMALKGWGTPPSTALRRRPARRRSQRREDPPLRSRVDASIGPYVPAAAVRHSPSALSARGAGWPETCGLRRVEGLRNRNDIGRDGFSPHPTTRTVRGLATAGFGSTERSPRWLMTCADALWEERGHAGGDPATALPLTRRDAATPIGRRQDGQGPGHPEGKHLNGCATWMLLRRPRSAESDRRRSELRSPAGLRTSAVAVLRTRFITTAGGGSRSAHRPALPSSPAPERAVTAAIAMPHDGAT